MSERQEFQIAIEEILADYGYSLISMDEKFEQDIQDLFILGQPRPISHLGQSRTTLNIEAVKSKS